MSVVEEVQKYYGETLQSSSDLKTSACCPVDAMPEHIRLVLRDIHDEVKDRFYGCGSPVPPVLHGKTVLDLGCGTGRDCYILSRLGGPDSRIIGVDMTPEQLAVAEAHVDYHRQKFGYDSANTEFRLGYIEDLAALGIEDNSVDIITSNCVLNLADDKAKVFREIFRVLKPGGELYFSDVFCAQRIPEVLRKDPVLHGECLSGAMYTEDFRRLLAQLGCQDFRVMSKGKIDINDPEVEAKIGMYDFFSITIRA
ncbi:MAG: methyltransferase domain-containing protein, partial [Pseudomonadales bacterium]|nr:methyltransferase domain-containing protein [Pseudomonadales bacterium]